MGVVVSVWVRDGAECVTSAAVATVGTKRASAGLGSGTTVVANAVIGVRVVRIGVLVGAMVGARVCAAEGGRDRRRWRQQW